MVWLCHGCSVATFISSSRVSWHDLLDSFFLSSTVGVAYAGVVLKCQFGGSLQT